MMEVPQRLGCGKETYYYLLRTHLDYPGMPISLEPPRYYYIGLISLVLFDVVSTLLYTPLAHNTETAGEKT